MKAKDIITDLGHITAGFSDTVNGKEITSSSICMGIHAGEATLQHEGKEHKITITHTLNASLAIQGKHRTFYLDLKNIINHAVEAGLLKETIDFPAADESKQPA